MKVSVQRREGEYHTDYYYYYYYSLRAFKREKERNAPHFNII